MESVQSSSFEPVSFTGETGEYFRIWIVNIALTIVTLGIYSAWATVRTRRYFYGHTELAGHTFDFHASPKAILIGRIIAVAMAGAYFGSSYIHPFAPLAIILTIFALVPWLVTRARSFRMRYTSYRGIRFGFERNYADAFKAYYGGTLLAIVTLGFGMPTSIFWRNRFAVDNLRFGKTAFKLNSDSSEFYSIYWKMVGLSFVGAIAISIFGVVLGMSGFAPEPGKADSVNSGIFGLVMVLPIYAWLGAVGVYFAVRIRNHIWSHTTLGDNQFLSTLSVTEMVKIYAVNIIAIALSLGLLVPWAKIRLAKYRAQMTEVSLADDWESYVASDISAESAIGDEVGSAFDIEVDIGI